MGKKAIQYVSIGALLIALVVGWLTKNPLFIKVYPVVISTLTGTVFLISLYFPPSMVERFARLKEKNLPEAAIPYLKTVTKVWVVFLYGNAVVALGTVLYGNWKIWVVYNGCISYMLMGGLIVGEYLIRKKVKQKHEQDVS